MIVSGLAPAEAAVNSFREQTVRILAIHDLDLFTASGRLTVAELVPEIDTAPN